MSNTKPVLECKNLTKVFEEGKGTIEIFNHLHFQIQPGEQVAIMGASGAGKSTLLHIMGGLAQPTSGEVWIQGQNIHQLSEKERCHLRNNDLGFIYQFHHLLPEFSVLENVAMPLLIRGYSVEQAQHEAHAILKKVNLHHRLEHRLAELSGGERQRTAIARALVTKPKCLFADEPTGNLDFRTAETVYNVLLELNAELGTSFIIVTHDAKLASRMQRVYELYDGRLVERY